MPVEADGTRKFANTLPYISALAYFPSSVSSKLKLTVAPTINPAPLMLTEVPTEPCEGFKVIVGPFAPYTIEIDMLRVSTIRDNTTSFSWPTLLTRLIVLVAITSRPVFIAIQVDIRLL